jgi:hypothetical protein
MSMNSQKTTYFSVLETFYSLGKLEMAQIFRKFAPKLTIQAFISLQKWTNTYPKSPVLVPPKCKNLTSSFIARIIPSSLLLTMIPSMNPSPYSN